MSGALDSAFGGILLLGFFILWWFSAIKARERARDVARRFCEQQGWQLLDQTVALHSMRPARAEDRLQWRRRYRFDFSPDGGQRRGGELVLLGNQLERITADLDDGQLIE